MAFTFQRDAVDPKYMVLAKFFSDMGNSQRADNANREAAEYEAQERKRKEAESMIKMMIDNGLFDQAQQMADQSGVMQPPGGWESIGQTLSDRKGAEIAAAAEAKRLEGDQQMADIRNLQLAGQNGGFLNEGMSTETIDSPFMSMLTGKAQGAPAQVQTERELFAGSEGMTPQQAESIEAVRSKLSPEQLMSIRQSRMSPEEQLKAIQSASGVALNAKEQSDAGFKEREVKVDERGANLDDAKFNYEKKQDIKKEAASLLKEAAGAGLPPDEYKNLAGLLDDARAAIKPQVDALGAGREMRSALESGNSEIAQAAMVTFMKALDDSVAREGEVREMVNRMGGIVGIRNKMSSFVNGKADDVFNEKMKGLIDLVNRKNTALIDERIAGFDIQAEAAGPGAQDYYNRWRSTVRGSSGGGSPKPDGAGSPRPGRRLDPSKRINTGTMQ